MTVLRRAEVHDILSFDDIENVGDNEQRIVLITGFLFVNAYLILYNIRKKNIHRFPAN
jgi:hypothetical protein